MGKCMAKPQDTSRTANTNTSIKETKHSFDAVELADLKIEADFEIDQISQKLIHNALSKNHLFRGLTLEDFEAIFPKLTFVIAEKGQYIFKQDSYGSMFFIINSGKVEVIVNNRKRVILSKENCFGELALLSNSKRKASVKALSKCSFWVLNRDHFFSTLKKIYSRSYDKIFKLISNTCFFTNFPDNQKDQITKLAIHHKYEDQEQIIHEGDEGDVLYILKYGSVIFKKSGEEILRYSNPGEMFGEGSMLTGYKRSATCISLGQTELISLDRSSMQKVFGNDFKNILLKNIAKNALTSDRNLHFLDKNDVIEISENLEWKVYNKFQIVIPSNYKKNLLLKVVCTGTIVCPGENSQRINSYEIIGLNNDNEKNLKPFDYISEGETIIGEISKRQLQKVLKININDLFDSLERVKMLKRVSIFRTLSLDSLKAISNRMEKFRCLEGQELFKAGSDAMSLFIIKSGTIEIYIESKILRILGPYETFGERCIREKARSANARSKTKSEIYIVNRDDLISLPEIKTLQIELNRRKYYQTNIDIYQMKVQNETPYISDDRRKICIRKPKDKTLYDLIIISKSSLETPISCYFLASEKEIMLQLEHRLIVKLVKTTHNDNFVFFVTEHIKSKSLKDLIPLDENYLKIFTLYLVSVLEYLHDKDIIYRNLCTENIIISTKGLPYLYNFSDAKIINGRTYTRVGNPYYRSPEMIMGRGYSKSTDYWSLGVILFEIAYGCLPFTIKENDDPVVAYEKILHVKHGTNCGKSDYLNDLLMKLMAEANQRYGCENIRKCSWMNNFEWDKINMNLFEGYKNEKFKVAKTKVKSKIREKLTVENFVKV